jgi:serine/threonine protein kinase
MPTDPARAQAVFLAAADLADPAERAAYLDRECAGDATLRHRVEALLRAHDQPDSILDAPIVPAAGGETRTQARPELADTRTHGDGTSDDDLADALSVLAPPGRADSLGRLGHYEVLEVLGRGGFGIVYRAFDDVLQRVVAVKVLAPSLGTTSPARKRFLREARSSAQVRHENVVHVYAVEEQPLPYLVMEFVPGETLQQRLDRTGPLDVPEVLRIGRQVAAGLAAAHDQGLIHRDIKPSNILIDSGAQHVKITDFGLARAVDDASLTRSGAVAGTPMYMAPEQARGEPLDHRADLFSLGSVLYAMLTGRPPFRAGTSLAVLKRVTEDTPRPIREVIPEVPNWLCRIVAKLHAKDPAGRFQTAREVADLLADCEQQFNTHGTVPDHSRIPRVGRQARKQRSPVFVIALVLVLVFGLPVILACVGLAAWFLMPVGADQNPNRISGPDGVSDLTGRAGMVVDEGWVPLFNGKDLTGWRQLPEDRGKWMVIDGVLSGGGPKPTHLFTARTDYQDFELLIEMRVVDPMVARVGFRCPERFHAFGVAPLGYQIWIPGGSVVAYPAEVDLAKTPADVFPKHDWFTLEVTARGDRFTVLVDGRQVAEATDGTHGRGSITLSGGPAVFYRKVDIRRLPSK